jgi:hypothetical protein
MGPSSSSAPRRDNGLHAPSYDRLRDVETHLVDGLLDRLRDVDVAAYSAPTPGKRGPYGDTVLPGQPSDSVWVDSRRRDQARDVTDRYLAEVAEELVWAGIVADFDMESPDEVPRWPASEDLPDAPAGDGSGEGGDDDGTSGDDPGERFRTYSSFEDLRAATPAPKVARPDPEDHFEPPPPPPLPQVDTVTRFAWAGFLGGPLLIVLAALAGFSLAGWVGLLALVSFMAGFVTLIARMKERPPTDSGPDDGAVV